MADNTIKTFNFSIDRKVTIWRKELYQIEAESYDEAVRLMKKEMKSPIYDERGFYSTEFDMETEQELSPKENGGFATVALMDLNGNMNEEIATNIK